MRCDRVADALPGLVDGTSALQADARDHVDHCLRCQADLARYRRLRRELLALGARRGDVPPGLLAELLAGLDADGGRRARHPRRRAAYLGGIAAATAAGVGGVLVLAARGRRLAG